MKRLNRGGKRHQSALALVALVLLGLHTPARAQAYEPSVHDAAYDEMLRERCRAPNRRRAFIEELSLLTFGGIIYWIQKDVNAKDWDVPVVADELWRRFTTFELVSFDSNRYYTNQFRHPGAGTGYHLIGRTNGLGFAESLAFNFGSSLLWEYVWEFREKVSLNDQIVTTSAGSTWGEIAYQFGELHHELGPKWSLARVLTWPFGQLRAAHDYHDGILPVDTQVFSTRRFRLLGGAEYRTQVGDAAASDTDLAGTLALRTELVTLPGYRREGSIRRAFKQGVFQRFDVDFSFSDVGLSDVDMYARVVPWGFVRQEIHGTGRRRRGWLAMVGLLNAFSMIDRRHALLRDQISATDVIGPTGRLELFLGPASLMLELDAALDFIAVRSLGYPAYAARTGEEGLRSELRDQGYYFGAGAAVTPRARLDLFGVELAAQTRWITAWPINGVDRFEEEVTRVPDLRDLGWETRAWLSAPLPWTDQAFRLRLELNHTARDSTIEDIYRDRALTRWGLYLGHDF